MERRKEDVSDTADNKINEKFLAMYVYESLFYWSLLEISCEFF